MHSRGASVFSFLFVKTRDVLLNWLDLKIYSLKIIGSSPINFRVTGDFHDR